MTRKARWRFSLHCDQERIVITRQTRGRTYAAGAAGRGALLRVQLSVALAEPVVDPRPGPPHTIQQINSEMAQLRSSCMLNSIPQVYPGAEPCGYNQDGIIAVRNYNGDTRAC